MAALVSIRFCSLILFTRCVAERRLTDDCMDCAAFALRCLISFARCCSSPLFSLNLRRSALPLEIFCSFFAASLFLDSVFYPAYHAWLHLCCGGFPFSSFLPSSLRSFCEHVFGSLQHCDVAIPRVASFAHGLQAFSASPFECPSLLYPRHDPSFPVLGA